jgi:intraflagellar transport protein 46
VLDEPATRQSDPTSLDLFLRLHAKQAHLQPVAVRSIEQADKHPKKVSAWIANVQEVHRQKPPPTVSYSKPMPDVEQLMQVWPQEVEEALKEVRRNSRSVFVRVCLVAMCLSAVWSEPVLCTPQSSVHMHAFLPAYLPASLHSSTQTPLPPPELNMSLPEYARLCCALLDIPVHGNVVESLHVMFSLYSEFKDNQHFQQ